MPQKRSDDIPLPSLSIWKKDGKFWRVEREDLLGAIKESAKSEQEIKNRMGAGYARISEALNGQSISIWGVKHIEWGLEKVN